MTKLEKCYVSHMRYFGKEIKFSSILNINPDEDFITENELIEYSKSRVFFSSETQTDFIGRYPYTKIVNKLEGCFNIYVFSKTPVGDDYTSKKNDTPWFNRKFSNSEVVVSTKVNRDSN